MLTQRELNIVKSLNSSFNHNVKEIINELIDGNETALALQDELNVQRQLLSKINDWLKVGLFDGEPDWAEEVRKEFEISF